MRNFSALGIDVFNRTSGKVKTYCPWCRDQRTNKHDKSLSVNIDTGLYKCHYCQQAGYVPDETELRQRREQQERCRRQREQRRRGGSGKPRPQWHEEYLHLPQSIADYLTGQRGLTPDTLLQARVTGQWELMPGGHGEEPEAVIGFNYFEDGQLVNVKYRTLDKRFKMVAGAELIPYRIDAIACQPVCYITEGEIDALTLVQCGFPETISVPSGGSSKLDWMDRFVESHFEDKQRIVLAMDDDSVGRTLTAELVRRLGAERCYLVRWSEGCKDANEQLLQHGAESVVACVAGAEEVPIEGIFSADQLADELRSLYLNGMSRGAETGWENLDRLVTFEPGRFMVVSGRPGEGKSEWIDELCLRLCVRHEWRVAYFSPENMPLVLHLRKLAEKLLGFPFCPGSRMTDELYERVQHWLADNICHILPPDDEYTLDNILTVARQLVARRGVRILVCDPLNRIEQRLEAGQTELQYISSVLNRLVRFAQQHRVLVILVAHPRKVNRSNLDGRQRRVEMNDINGSADFGNKADYCFIVDRDDPQRCTHIHIDKVRFKYLGNRGEVHFHYDLLSGRYVPCELQPDPSGVGKVVKPDWRWFNMRWV